ncbi:hypothetical protein KCU79_g109, partial [Aureobasidium melanogenum]
LPRREGPKPESHSKRHRRELTETQVCVGIDEGCSDWSSEVGAPRQANAQHDRSASIGTCLDLSQIDSLRLIVDEGRRVTLLDGKRGAVIVRRSFDRSQRTINKPSLIVHHPRQISYLQRSLAHLLDCYIRLCAFNHD